MTSTFPEHLFRLDAFEIYIFTCFLFTSGKGRVPLPQPWHISFKWIFNQTLLFHMADLPQSPTWKSLCDESVRTLSAPVDTSLGTPSPEVSFCFQISSTVNPLAILNPQIPIWPWKTVWLSHRTLPTMAFPSAFSGPLKSVPSLRYVGPFFDQKQGSSLTQYDQQWQKRESNVTKRNLGPWREAVR